MEAGPTGGEPPRIKVIPLDGIVGSVDKVRDFDRRFRPTSGRSRERWKRLSRASRTGEVIPPIEVYQVGDDYFVRDGHHRVSVARSLRLEVIEASVTAIETFLSRSASAPVPISNASTGAGSCSNASRSRARTSGRGRRRPVRLRRLAETVEAWAARTMHAEGAYFDKATMAARWYAEEFRPVVDMIEEAGVRGKDERPAEAYLRVAGERYRLIREHEWNTEVMVAVTRKGKKGADPGCAPRAPR